MGLSRRNAIVGFGGLIAGGGALVGTGAFTTVQAERTVNVETAGDSGAFLALEPAKDQNGNQYPNADDYAEIDTGLLEVTIPDVNLNAITHLDKVFQVTNNGTQRVVLYIEELPDNTDDLNAIDIGALTNQLKNTSSLDGQTQAGNADGGDGIAASDVADLSYPASLESYPGAGGYSNIGVLIGIGQTLELGVYIDISDDNPTDGLNESGSSDVNAGETLLENIAIHASAEAANNNNYNFVEANTNTSP
jgi:hypothetical protein